MRNNRAKQIALGGMMAALAVVIMSLGGMIPSATFVCPMLCCLILQIVRTICGDRMAWAWYGAVAILSLLMGPDKEAAAVFVFLGYYPILKPKFDKSRLKWVWKLLYFNVVILAMYWLLIHLFGMAQLAQEWEELGIWMTGIMLLLGNVTFFLLDRVLSKKFRRRR
jgi:hypothetical protein